MLQGKSAIITGSTSGIGLGILQALARHGCNVMMNGFGPAEEIQKQCDIVRKETGVKVLYCDADMTNPESVRAMVATAQSEFGGLEILVNNAGIQHTAPIEDFPDDKWDAIIAINLSSTFHTTKAALPLMKTKKWGRIINIASAHGLVASPFKAAYVAAKHGVVGFTKVTALENAELGITSNAICPGFVLTPLVEKQIEDLMRSENKSREEVTRNIILAKHPNKEFTRIDQVADMAVYLCTDSASCITGTALSLDGGWTAQ